MYNGIGLPTPRGSGTNGFVQRNLALSFKTKERGNFKAPNELSTPSLKKPNTDIIEHDRKRKIEVKCLEFQSMLEDQGYSEEEIDKRVQTYRESLLEERTRENRDKHGRIIVKETHEIAEAQLHKNEKLRQAFGISEYFVEGSSFDPERHTKEAAAKAAIEDTKKYALIPSPPSSEDESALTEKSTEPFSKSKKKKKKSSISPLPEATSVKKKKKKKHKRKSVSVSDDEKVSNHKSKSGKEFKKQRHVSPSPVKTKHGKRNEESNETELKKTKKKKLDKHREERSHKSRISRSSSPLESEDNSDNNREYRKKKKKKRSNPTKADEKKKRSSSRSRGRSSKRDKISSLTPDSSVERNGTKNADYRAEVKKQHSKNKSVGSHSGSRYDKNDDNVDGGRRLHRSKRKSSPDDSELDDCREMKVSSNKIGSGKENSRGKNSVSERKRDRRSPLVESRKDEYKSVSESASSAKRKRRHSSFSSEDGERAIKRSHRNGSSRDRYATLERESSRDKRSKPFYCGGKKTRLTVSNSDSDHSSPSPVRTAKLKSKLVRKTNKTDAVAEVRCSSRSGAAPAAVEAKNSSKKRALSRRDSNPPSDRSSASPDRVKMISKLAPKTNRFDKVDSKYGDSAPKSRNKNHDPSNRDSDDSAPSSVEDTARRVPRKAKNVDIQRMPSESFNKLLKSYASVGDKTKSSRGDCDRGRMEHVEESSKTDRRVEEVQIRTTTPPSSSKVNDYRSKKVAHHEVQRNCVAEPSSSAVENGTHHADGKVSNRDGSTSSSLSYSPMEKYPHRYKDILSDVPRRGQKSDVDSSKDDKTSSAKIDDRISALKVDDRGKKGDSKEEPMSSSSSSSKNTASVTSQSKLQDSFLLSDVPLPPEGVSASSTKTSALSKKDEPDDLVRSSSRFSRVDDSASTLVKSIPPSLTQKPNTLASSISDVVAKSLRKRDSSSSSDSSHKRRSRSISRNSSSSNTSRSSGKHSDSDSSSSSSSRSSSRSSTRRRSRKNSSSGSSSSSSSSDSSRSRSRGRSATKNKEKKKKRARSPSGSNSHSYSSSLSSSRSRSISIPRRKGSPSFLERRRITSARKRPVPYQRSSVLRSTSPCSSTISSSPSSSISRRSRTGSPGSRNSRTSLYLPKKRSPSFRTPSPLSRSPFRWGSPVEKSNRTGT